MLIDLDINWELLRTQKKQLTHDIWENKEWGNYARASSLEGILQMIDIIQDQAAEKIGEEEVFGVLA